MKMISCPHCTFINPPSKLKCGVCLRLLRKRERKVDELSPASASSPQKRLPSPSSTPPEHESSSSSEVQVRCDVPRPPMPSAAPESSTTATSQVAPPPDVEAMAATSSLVPTLFSTASGRPVTVRRESLQNVAERLGDLISPDMETRVPTLFQTGRGMAVTVRKSLLQKAQISMGSLGTDDALPRSVPTLSATHGGAAAQAPKVPIQTPAERLGLRPLADKDDTADASPVHSTEAPGQASQAAAQSKGLPTTICDHRLHAPAHYGFRGQRRGFVPPQQRTTAKAPATFTHATQPLAQKTGLTTLRFNPDACVCRSITPSPSLSSITSHTFSFKGSDCGSVLAALLGVSGAESVQPCHWHAMLLKLGASPKHCTIEWCHHALVSAMARVHFLTQAPSGALSTAFSPVTVLLCVMQMYNAEMVNGERPALRKMVEGDISCASLVVLYMSSVSEERRSPHLRIVTLSDGIYHLKVTCDIPLSNLIREGVLRPGKKMIVCGAKSLLQKQCAPTECDTQVVLSINYNCVRAVGQQTPLGVCHGEPLPLPLSLVHSLGGLVPAIEGVVARALPPFFISEEVQETLGTAGGICPTRNRVFKTVRNAHAQLQVSDRLHREAEARADGDTNQSKLLSRVTSLLIVKDNAEALVQQWETVEERVLLTDDDSSASLPVEGSWITIYAVNPAKSRTAAPPFARAKLFFSSRKLHYAPSKNPLQHLRRICMAATDNQFTTGVGEVADVCGLYMGSHRNEQGTFALLLLHNNTYALLHIPVPSAGRVLSLPLPTTERLSLVVLNATFVAGEDPVAGSDCCRFFANEYTALLQRSTKATLKEALETAAQLRGLVDAAPQRYASRKAEVFRCLDVGEGGAGFGLGGSTALANHDTQGIPEVPSDVWRDAPRASPGATATSLMPLQRDGRLPYYLRQDDGRSRAGKLQGVVLPSAAVLTPTVSTALHNSDSATKIPSGVREPLLQPGNSTVGGRSQHYGNIVDLMFLFNPRLNRRAWHPLTDPLQLPRPGAAQENECFKRVQLCWRLSANSADDMTCTVDESSVLSCVLESVCPLQELCSVIADERHIDISLARSERLAQWRRQDSLSVWWRFFTDSRALASPADLDAASGEYLWWLPAEWSEAMRTVHAKLEPAFFYFSLRGEVLRHVRLISDCCNVAELPCD
ncbi:hypothetical protein, conserved [Leishmania tarentolae]|uniref:BRCA2 OB1 domain-containing protein n=1 Tax=Leishmania tarentolae TaxID=5689 RepID=A0A640KEP2_LEITA|nr:hypothetical protein, conserved [Leishmania tarentolae]